MDDIGRLDEALREVGERAARLARAQQRAATLEERVATETARVEALAENAELEEEDVRRVEAGGFMVLLESLFEGRAERLVREKAEAARARMAWDQARAQLEGMRAELATVRQDLATYAGADDELATLQRQKRALLAAQGHPDASRLQAIDAEVAVAQVMVVELEEALAAGRAARDRMDALEQALKLARQTAEWDVMSGGGWAMHAKKKTELETAHRASLAAKEAIERFDSEVADVGERVAAAVVTVEYDVVMDFFFDNVFTDLAMVGKLKDALEQVQRARVGIAERYGQLREQKEATEALLVALRDEEQALLGPG